MEHIGGAEPRTQTKNTVRVFSKTRYRIANGCKFANETPVGLGGGSATTGRRML